LELERPAPPRLQLDPCDGIMRTVVPGTLTILSAYPDPPFDVMKDGTATGFDIELMRAVCGRLSLELRPLSYEGENFNDIFQGLAQATCDAVISGTTITPDRAAIARFSRPYLQFNQGIAVNRRLTPRVSSTADLRSLVAGIQKGNTSDIVARHCCRRAISLRSNIILIMVSVQRSMTLRPDALVLSSSSSP
jgi:polar amino acid transport system substrate-binding protein